MYNEVPTNMNFVDREKKIEKFWVEKDIFGKSINEKSKAEPYVFYDGPPTYSYISKRFLYSMK